MVQLLNSGFMVASADAETITFANYRVRLKCRLDPGYFDEIFKQKTYGTVFRDNVVLDIGASSGDSSTWFAM